MAFILIILAFREPSILPQAALWLLVVAVNFLIAIVQQQRAIKKFDALRRLTEPIARVIREGRPTELPIEQLVPGDLIELEQGSSVPADARIITFNECVINEASLTGESFPVRKNNIPALDIHTPLSDRVNMVYRGTFLQIGVLRALVIRTGVLTELGKISTELGQLSTGEIPLQSKVNILGKWLTALMGMFLAVQLIINGWLYSQESNLLLLDQSILIRKLATSIITAMAVYPINIPLLTTIVLLSGALTMATHRVVIRDLSVIESLGRISILCSDKTGTITWSQMTANRLYDAGTNQLFAVTGVGYNPSGIIFPIETIATADISDEYVSEILSPPSPGSSYELLLICSFLNNDAHLIVDESFEVDDITRSAIGDPTEVALLTLVNKSQLDSNIVRNKYVTVREYTFDSQLKRMTKVCIIPNRDQNEGHPGVMVFSKGATEIILERCTTIGGLHDIKEFTSEKKAEIQAFADEFAQLGFRILSLAYRPMTELPPQEEYDRKWVEEKMTYLGFICFLDPPRDGIKESVHECLSAGITPIMVTGDSPITAGTVARQVDILKEEQTVHEGAEAANLDDDGFQKTTVFARVSPQDKQTIVHRYQNFNRVVAMTGDGVNDALAISMADAGIAMGLTGTDITKQAADLIVTDNSFSSIVQGIREGRGLFQKIRMMIFFYLCVNIAEAIIYFGASLIPNFTLLDNWQRIYIFSTIHSFPAFGLIGDHFSQKIMERKPYDTAGIFDKRLVTTLLLEIFAMAGIYFLVYYITYHGIIPVTSYNTGGFVPTIWKSALDPLRPSGWAQAKARTMFLTTVFLSESLLIISIRRINQNFFVSLKKAPLFVYIMIAIIPILHVILMYQPEIQFTLINFIGLNLEIIRLAWYDWIICVGLGFTPIAMIELYKWHIRRKGEFF